MIVVVTIVHELLKSETDDKSAETQVNLPPVSDPTEEEAYAAAAILYREDA